jgi:radical SAM family uncharacterized protein/radical SAM-linked protein
MIELTDRIQKKFLPFVEKPLRYTGGELNAVRKNLENVTVHGCCCFPDLYDIGMSHHGLQILYNIVNSNKNWALSRCFHPWGDAEKVMREAEIPLFTLEYFSPVREADWIGFSVQYELQYTNLVNMIDLAGLNVLASQRGDGDPLIIAGGPCVNNPEPLTPFVDAFLVGDGEEAAAQICAAVEKHKEAGRSRILSELAGIRGFYIPSMYTYNSAGIFTVPDLPEKGSIKKPARIKAFDESHLPKAPLVPLMEVVHHRLSAEVMRGCTRGCRFCSAGMYYRPVREKDMAFIKAQVEDGVRCTGWRDVGLLSLSTADYSGITDLLSSMRAVKQAYHLRMSLPSTRIDALTREQLDELNAVAPITSFTIAPEAASPRLRKVINKDFTDESIYDTVRLLLERNAQTIKLYFMIGLPTEREEDVQAIIDMVREIASIMRARSPKLSLHVSLSPFSPKANTPFQWEGMESVEALEEKGRFVKRCLRDKKNVKVSYRDSRVTFLETVMARGDRRVGDVIMEAWKAGARFDGWDENFNFERWMEAGRTAGVDLELYTKNINIEEPLPWSAISTGVDTKFLLNERDLAFRGEITPDCRNGACSYCGACDESVSTRLAVTSGQPASVAAYGRRPRVAAAEKPAVGHRYRFFYEKKENVRFLGHMDMVGVFHRAMIAAGFPLAFSQGFNPHPRVSFGPPLPFGATGLNEAFDIETKSRLDGDPMIVNQWLPAGLLIKSCAQIHEKASLSSTITAARYRISPPRGFSFERMEEMLGQLLEKKEIIIQREKNGQLTQKNIRPAIINAFVNNSGSGDNPPPCWEAALSLAAGGAGVSCKPSEFISALCPDEKFSDFLVCRVECVMGN